MSFSGLDDPERDLHRAAAARVAGRRRATGSARPRRSSTPGAFGYIAGGAGAESTMRANLDAFERWRLRPRMLTGNAQRDISVEVLGTALAGAVLPRADRRALDRPRGGRGRRRARGGRLRRADASLSSAATHSIEEIAERRRRAALVPALLGQRPRDLRELRPPRRGGRLRRDRRHARHADARLAAARPAPRVPAVHSAARAAASSSATRSSCSRLDKTPEEDPLTAAATMLATFPNLGLTWDDLDWLREQTDAADARQGRADRRRRAARARSTASTASSSRTTAAARSTAPSPRSTRSSRCATRCPTRSC